MRCTTYITALLLAMSSFARAKALPKPVETSLSPTIQPTSHTQADMSGSDSRVVSQFTSETAFDSVTGSINTASATTTTAPEIFTVPTTLSTPFCESSGWCTLMATCSVLFPTGYIECFPSVTTSFPNYAITNFAKRAVAISKAQTPSTHNAAPDTRDTSSSGSRIRDGRPNLIARTGADAPVSSSISASQGVSAFTTTVEVEVTIVETVHRPTGPEKTTRPTIATSTLQMSAGSLLNDNTSSTSTDMASKDASAAPPTTLETQHSYSSSSKSILPVPQHTGSLPPQQSISMITTGLASHSAKSYPISVSGVSVKGGYSGAETVGLGSQKISQACLQNRLSGWIPLAMAVVSLALMLMMM